MPRIFFASIAIALLGCILGCRDDGPLARVSGQVLVDGEPAATGSISFFPDEGQAAPTTGDVITNGRYTSDVPIGKCKVEIRVSRQVGSRKLYDTPDSPVQPTLVESLPPKYNSETELSYTAERGTNTKDWNLLSDGK